MWEKEFDEKFVKNWQLDFRGGYIKILDFIRQEIKKSREEVETKLLNEGQEIEMKWMEQLKKSRQETIDECLGVLNNKRAERHMDEGVIPCGNVCLCGVEKYNKALSEAIKALEELKKR